jgi:predicted O-linked N-acetylglucosamine transferase (SPINDLY family)
MSDNRSRVHTLLKSRNYEEAKLQLQEMCEKMPGDAQAWFLLGAVYGELQAYEECARCSSKSVLLDPGNINAHYNLGQAYMHLGRPQEAIKAYRTVIELRSDHVVALKNLGRALLLVRDFNDASNILGRARALIPNDVELLEDLGRALDGAGRFEAAIECYKAAIAIRPDLTSAYIGLARLLFYMKRHEETLDCCDDALRVDPDNVDAILYRGHTRALVGQGNEACMDYLRAIELAPESSIARSALLLDLNYTCDDPKKITTAHKEWDAAISAPLRSQMPHENSRDPARRLRVGYVSLDFFRHPVAYFFEPLLQSHNANEFETYCYARVEKPDPVTGRLRALAHHWRDIQGLGPAAVADLVRTDSIDILVDLGGHTAPNLLLVFARKPAPIQVTWLGYPNTTGMGTMDYRITDEWADPTGMAEAYHTETLVRLPNGFLCYRPFIKAPPVSPSPATRTGYVTFGSFNSLRKITPEVLKVWARILSAVPGSRLLLKRSPLRYATVADRYRRPFLEAGVEPDRVILQDSIPSQAEHLALYSQVDVGLDSFPYNGTTTTCEALWMGVPVVCLAGNRHAGRVGVSILTQMELTDLIADSPEDYARIAVELANAPIRLSELRNSLRQRMSVSPLCDAKTFARTMEDAYRKMWRNWCET